MEQIFVFFHSNYARAEIDDEHLYVKFYVECKFHYYLCDQNRKYTVEGILKVTQTAKQLHTRIHNTQMHETRALCRDTRRLVTRVKEKKKSERLKK